MSQQWRAFGDIGSGLTIPGIVTQTSRTDSDAHDNWANQLEQQMSFSIFVANSYASTLQQLNLLYLTLFKEVGNVYNSLIVSVEKCLSCARVVEPSSFITLLCAEVSPMHQNSGAARNFKGESLNHKSHQKSLVCFNHSTTSVLFSLKGTVKR